MDSEHIKYDQTVERTNRNILGEGGSTIIEGAQC